MSVIKHVTLQTIVAHDFRYDPRTIRRGVDWKTFFFCQVRTRRTEAAPTTHTHSQYVSSSKISWLMFLGK